MVNKAIIVGNLGRDPEVRFTAGGKAVARFSVATTDRWTDQQGQRQEKTEWHNIVVWGKQAETCGQYLAKGRQVFVEGRIQTRNYDDKDGNKRYITEIIANDVQFLGGGDRRENTGRGRESEPPPPSDGDFGGYGGGANAGGGGGPDDDIPF